MTGRIRLYLAWVSWTFVFCLSSSLAEKSEHVQTVSGFYQTQDPTGEYMFQFDKDEIFNVDLAHRETRWRLPQFGQLASYDTAGALQNIAVLKNNLEVFKQWSNFSKAMNVAPSILAYSKDPVVLGEPDELICVARKFFPPVIKMSWLKDNQPVTEGVSETDFYPAPDGSFSKFLYLATVPQKGEVYTCSVEHAGQRTNPTNVFWRPEILKSLPETTENILCGFGLFIGICGIITGIALICKGMKGINQRRGQ